mgnify:CR=1 FL=1
MLNPDSIIEKNTDSFPHIIIKDFFDKNFYNFFLKINRFNFFCKI